MSIYSPKDIYLERATTNQTIVREICQKWSETQFRWNAANWKWSECSASIPPIPPVPVVVVGNLPGVDAETLIQPWQLEEPWNPYKNSEKRKRLIKLICKVKNEPFEESKYVIENVKISIDDIKMVVKAVNGVELKINENIWDIQNNQ
jgi:hypothetical protein